MLVIDGDQGMIRCLSIVGHLNGYVGFAMIGEALFTRKELMQYLVRNVRESQRFEIGLPLACILSVVPGSEPPPICNYVSS